MVLNLSGNPTYQDLTAWSRDNFRVAGKPEVIAQIGVIRQTLLYLKSVPKSRSSGNIKITAS
jgi:hypothetical protein